MEGEEGGGGGGGRDSHTVATLFPVVSRLLLGEKSLESVKRISNVDVKVNLISCRVHPDSLNLSGGSD